MKSVLTKIIVSILCLVLLFGMIILGQVVYILNCSYPIGSRIAVDSEKNVISVNDDKDIRILQLSDTQISRLGDSLKSFGMIKRIVEKAKPDMIVMVGDNIMNDSPKIVLNDYIRFFDKFKIPWATVMGNHDYSAKKLPMDYQSKLYENSKYGLFKEGDIENSYGNYYYNLVRNGKLSYTFIFMDNAVEINENHLNWYSQTINSIKNINNGNVVPSMLFFHKPLRDTYYAYLNAVKFNKPIDGEKREGVAYLRNDAGVFDKVLELGSTKAIMYGHNHRNNFIVDYCNVKFCYGIKSTRASYHDKDMLGGNVYVLKSDNSFTVERVFV